MAITRTARGTATDKSSGLTLTVSAVQVAKNSTLVVGAAYDAGEGAPSLTWGTRVLDKPKASDGAGGIRVALFVLHNKDATATNDAVLTWDTTAPTAKAMFATQVAGARRRDFTVSNTGSSATPTSGALQATGFADEYLTGVFASEGPSGDTAGTPSLSYTSGQRAGTTGGGAASNVTVHETYKIAAATEDTRARKSSATSRDWAVICTGLKPIYSVTADYRITVDDVAAPSQAAADTLIDDDVTTRFPPNYTVEIL